MRTVILVALSVALGACGSNGPSTIEHTFDPCLVSTIGTVTAEQQASIDAAIAMWQAQPGGDTPIAIEFRNAAVFEFGFYDDHAAKIYANTELVDPQRSIVLAHELGHAFGLFHVTDRPSVMNPSNLTIAPTAEDIAAARAAWGACP